jgi:hypothetical protein
MSDRERPVFTIYERDIPAEMARIAVFVVDIGLNVEDDPLEADKHVGGCEGGGCLVRASPDDKKTGPRNGDHADRGVVVLPPAKTKVYRRANEYKI